MNRHRKRTIELLFDIIRIQFNLSDSTTLPLDFYNDRWVVGNTEEAEWLTRGILTTKLEISKDLSFAVFEHESILYFTVIGAKDSSSIPAGLEYFQMNSGLFTLLITELEIPVKSTISLLYLEENILSQSNNDPLYAGHSLTDLTPIFPNIHAFKITDDFPGDTSNIYQLISLFLTQNKDYISLPLSDKTLLKLNEASLLNSTILYYDNIVQALLSSNFKFAFLDLYRCIEMLYQLVYIDDTYNYLSLPPDFKRSTLLKAIDTKLNWRPIERSSLNRVLKDTPENYKSELIKVMKGINRNKESISDWIYDLRCNIVHLKTEQTTFTFNNDQWNQIIFGISQLITYWYTRYLTFD